MEFSFWKDLPTDTLLTLRVRRADEEEDTILKCKYSHVCNERGNEGLVYCYEYLEEEQAYDSSPLLYFDFYDGDVECCVEGGGEYCESILILERDSPLCGSPSVYVRIGADYFDQIQDKYETLDICNDFLYRGWGRFNDDIDNKFIREHLFVDSSCNRVSLYHDEALWINERDLVKLRVPYRELRSL